MSRAELTKEVLAATPTEIPRRLRSTALALAALGVVGLIIAVALGPAGALWTALLVGTVLILGLGVVGVLLSAIFQLTGARWGRAYRRLAEAGVAFIPLGALALAVLMLGGNSYLPWVHEHPHVGGKAVWLSRGFWDLRVAGAFALCAGLALLFLYYSLRRDFCVEGVRERFVGFVGRWAGQAITDPAAERARCEARLTWLAPALAIVYGVTFSLLGFDLIMALEPDWFSTLFGAWYFIGCLFAGLALLAIVSLTIKRWGKLDRFLTVQRQADLATLLFAFCLVNTDFFWNQFLTIWYANLPEETFWLIERAVDDRLPWHNLSWLALCGFFLIPFVALLLRRVRQNEALLSAVAAVVVCALFLVRFLEVAPALLPLEAARQPGQVALTLASAAMVFAGLLGAGLWLYAKLLTQMPILPVGDDIFAAEFGDEEAA